MKETLHLYYDTWTSPSICASR